MKTYESECKKLLEEVMRRRAKILEKQKEYYKTHPWRGLDGEPYVDELKEVTDWANEEREKLAKKYKRKISKRTHDLETSGT